ncbi:MAG: D-alanine--D-alanine ligase [Candidatus Microgenomates bacterium]|jgi:D-alanine-D-alanine ligase
MKKKLKVVVLSGGRSSEREISLLSGKEVLANIDKSRYNAKLLIVPKVGNEWTGKLIRLKPDLIFIALHGTFGEDGSIQGLLEQVNIPYTGSGVLASAIGMDKVVFKKLMRFGRIDVPRDIRTPPCFVKPSDQGSSVGASIVLNYSELKSAIKLANRYSNKVLLEEYLRGKELTCVVIGNKNPIAFPIIEIKPLKGKFFDYESKYTESGSEEIVPARISKSLAKKVQKIAIEVYKAVGCKGFGRVDFILKNDRPIVLEINTIPGLTRMSLVPKAAKAAGVSYSRLLDKIIGYAIEK